MKITRQLVRDRDTGKLCIQVGLGTWLATQELPEGMATWNEQEKKDFFDVLVPEMIRGLKEKRQDEQTALRRKAGRMR